MFTSDRHLKGRKPTDFRKRMLIFLDLEMTGSDPHRHEIIEVAWIVVNGNNFKILSSFVSKVKPLHLDTNDNEGLVIADFSEKKWENAIELEKVLEKLANVAPNAMLVGWAIFHDWEFLERAFEKYNITPKFNYRMLPVDTIAYAKLYKDKRLKGLGLRTGVLNYFGMKFPKQHGALVDAKLSLLVFKRLMKMK